MTTNEQKTIDHIDQLHKLLSDIHQENQKFREDVSKQVSTLATQIDQKHIPITLESDILRVLQQSINTAIQTTLTGYGNPLGKLILEVVDKHSVELKSLISDSFSQVIRTDEFKQSIVSAFSHKVAKTIISNNDGLFDKVSNELKQDANFKAKMVLAVSNVIEECLKRE